MMHFFGIKFEKNRTKNGFVHFGKRFYKCTVFFTQCRKIFNTEFSEKYTELTEILYNKKLHTKKRSNLICLKNFVNFMYFSVSFVMFFYAMSQRFFLLNTDDADLTDFHRYFVSFV